MLTLILVRGLYIVCVCVAYILYIVDTVYSLNCEFVPFNISLQPGGSPYHTIHLADTTLEGWNFQNLKQHRSNSWSESLDDLKVIQDSFGDTARNIKYVLGVQIAHLKNIVDKDGRCFKCFV